jgi:hypothetical protein
VGGTTCDVLLHTHGVERAAELTKLAAVPDSLMLVALDSRPSTYSSLLRGIHRAAGGPGAALAHDLQRKRVFQQGIDVQTHTKLKGVSAAPIVVHRLDCVDLPGSVVLSQLCALHIRNFS